MEMTLKELCNLYKMYSDDIIKCCNARSEYLRRNKGHFKFEELEESDLEGLRVYLLCDVLAMYEYLALESCEKVQNWFNNYNDVSCTLEECDDYKALLDSGVSAEVAKRIIEMSLKESLEPFRKRGIPADCLDYTV